MTTGAEVAAEESAHYKAVLSRFCSGVTVITGMDEEAPVGFSCQSFSSLSLDPPLVSFSPARTSTTWPRIRRAGRLCINILAADQEVVCRQFAARDTDKFDGIDWAPSENDAPRLPDTLAWLDCTVSTEVDGGDHTIVIARVTGLGIQREAPPLLFFRAAFNPF